MHQTYLSCLKIKLSPPTKNFKLDRLYLQIYYLPFPRLSLKKSQKGAESLEMEKKKNSRVTNLIENKCKELGAMTFQVNPCITDLNTGLIQY
jgi:hypothetical protein